jgi:hypothetical protein
MRYLPKKVEGWIGVAAGLTATGLWASNMIFKWLQTELERSLYGVIFLILMGIAIGFTYVANKGLNIQRAVPITLAVILVGIFMVMLFNGISMTLSADYKTYANSELGLLTGIQLLAGDVKEIDVNSIATFALGVRQLITAMSLFVPVIIVFWAGLSVITADSLDEAEGGILGIAAAVVVVIIVWLFLLVDVEVMSLMLPAAVFTKRLFKRPKPQLTIEKQLQELEACS